MNDERFCLVRDSHIDNWIGTMYFCEPSPIAQDCNGNTWKQVIPYKGNEHLLRTRDCYIPPKWEPKYDDTFFSPIFVLAESKDKIIFISNADSWSGRPYQEVLYRQGLVFRNRQMCEEFCRRVNSAVERIIEQMSE